MTAASHPILLRFDDLKGWRNDDVASALAVFQATSDQLDLKTWGTVCAGLSSVENTRVFVETYMLPVQFHVGQKAVFTGYFEPEIEARSKPDALFKHPIYRPPPEMAGNLPWHTREQIETSGILQNRGLEIAWLRDATEVFFLQVQGSGRLKFPNGEVRRVGFAAKNGQPYRSIGKEMIRLGLMNAAGISARKITDWIQEHPNAGRELMHHNPSYVFFKEITGLEPNDGPVGAMDHALTPERSLAVDPEHIPLGAPVWIEKEGEQPLNRLMVAQDVGSAIKGPNRADIFYGTGAVAGDMAGRVHDTGRMVVLLPRALAMKITGKVG